MVDSRKLQWYSAIELAPGIFTRSEKEPAYWTMALTRSALRCVDLRGAKCLDVGAVDGFISTLMCRAGAGRVIAVDCCDYSEQITTVKKAYEATFEYIPRVGSLSLVDRLLDAHKFGASTVAGRERLEHDQDFGFDVVVCGGVLYHIHSPLHLIGALRTLVRPGGLVILETAAIPDDRPYMAYNWLGQGYVYAHTDTWFPSVPLLDYLLRSFSLRPIDVFYRDQKALDVEGRRVGRGAIVCRAVDAPAAILPMHHQMADAASNFEFDNLYRRELEPIKRRSLIGYMSSDDIDLLATVRRQAKEPIPFELARLRLADTN